MSVNGLSFPTMTNKVNILITISTYETAQLITANLCQPMPTYANLCQPMPIKGETLGLYAIFDRSNQGPTYERPTVSRDQRSLQSWPEKAD